MFAWRKEGWLERGTQGTFWAYGTVLYLDNRDTFDKTHQLYTEDLCIFLLNENYTPIKEENAKTNKQKT